MIEEHSADIGEKIELRRFAKFEGAYVASYMHKSDPDLPPTLGVLVELDKPNAEVAKDLAQQIAALAPKYLSRDDVPADVVEKERRIAEATAREEGKPEQALPKIVEGRVNGFFKDFDAARSAVRQGQQEDDPAGCRRGRRNRAPLCPLQGRSGLELLR